MKLDVKQSKWHFLPNMITGRINPLILMTKDKKYMYVTAGNSESTERYDFFAQKWSGVFIPEFKEKLGLLNHRGNHVSWYGQNEIMIFGGF